MISALLLALAEPLPRAPASGGLGTAGTIDCPLGRLTTDERRLAGRHASHLMTDQPADVTDADQRAFDLAMGALKGCAVRFSWPEAARSASESFMLMSFAAETLEARMLARRIDLAPIAAAFLEARGQIGHGQRQAFVANLRKQGLNGPLDEPEDVVFLYLDMLSHRVAAVEAFSAAMAKAP